MPIDRDMPEFWNVDRMPDAAPRSRAGTLLMIAEVLGEANRPLPTPLPKMISANAQYGKSGREQHQRGERGRDHQQAGGGEQPLPVLVRQVSRHRPGDQEAYGQRQHVDPSPQRRVGIVIAVQRQPDAGQPDDEHELQAAPGDRPEQGGRVPGREGPDLEQAHPEHRVGDLGLDDAERGQQGGPAGQPSEHPWVRPPGGVPAVGLDAVGDRGQQRPGAEREGEVARPVDPGPPGDGELAQAPVRPHRAERADRHADPEHRAPVPQGEQPAEQQPDELPGDPGDLVDPQCHAPLMLRERVGQDRRRVGHQHRPAERLHHPPPDQPQRAAAAGERVHGQDDRRGAEHGEPEVVDAHPAVHVAEPPQAHHQDRLD